MSEIIKTFFRHQNAPRTFEDSNTERIAAMSTFRITVILQVYHISRLVKEMPKVAVQRTYSGRPGLLWSIEGVGSGVVVTRLHVLVRTVSRDENASRVSANIVNKAIKRTVIATNTP